MSTTIIRPKTREEWLDVRKGGIGSSEVATIVGLNPYESPYQLWRRKTGQDPAKEETFAMRAGHYLEDAVSKFWEDETGKTVIKSSAGDWIVRNDAKPFIQVSPDRTYWLGDKHAEKGILECKTTQKTIDADDLPKTWFCQVQYQLGGAEMTQGSLAWLTAGRTFGYKDLTFVPDFYAWLVEEVEKFWTDNVLGGKEPEAANVQDILLKYNKHVASKVVEVNDEVYEAYAELRALKPQLAELEAKKKELEDKLKMAFGDAEAISYGGDTLATWKAPKDSAKFDTKAFETDHPELAREYTHLVPGTRRFLLK